MLQIGDVYFEFTTTKLGNTITTFNFIIKTRMKDALEEKHLLALKEDAINLLKRGFNFTDFHIKEIWKLLSSTKLIKRVHTKITALWLLLFEKKIEVTDAAVWGLTALKNEFEGQY